MESRALIARIPRFAGHKGPGYLVSRDSVCKAGLPQWFSGFCTRMGRR
jgi:hypothetical protein